MSSYSIGQMNQLAGALESSGFTPDDVTKLGQFKDLEGVRGVVRDTHRIVDAPLLTRVNTFTTTSIRPRIGKKTLSFLALFEDVDLGERAEELTLYKLERLSVSTPIIDALGGEKTAKVTLADFWATLAKKEHDGDLTSTLGFVLDVDGMISAVSAEWRYVRGFGNGWKVDSMSSIKLDVPWSPGYQVLSSPPAD